MAVDLSAPDADAEVIGDGGMSVWYVSLYGGWALYDTEAVAETGVDAQTESGRFCKCRDTFYLNRLSISLSLSSMQMPTPSGVNEASPSAFCAMLTF